MNYAILRRPSAHMESGERTHMDRAAIDPALALSQHQAYAQALEAAGFALEILDADNALADCAFVEDMALILPEAAILLRPGAVSRQAEREAVAAALPKDRPVLTLAAGRMDGGDILVIGKTIYAGLSTRTDADGHAALASLTESYGYSVVPIPVPGALHLKTAVTALDEQTVLLNPDWISETPFTHLRRILVDPSEPFGANTLSLGGKTLVQASTPKTAARIEAAGFKTLALDISEFAKAEAGLTCLSLIVPARA
jgi:dimethylargininase